MAVTSARVIDHCGQLVAVATLQYALPSRTARIPSSGGYSDVLVDRADYAGAALPGISRQRHDGT
jgi:hypothetical protein